jgi:hypothetical protein
MLNAYQIGQLTAKAGMTKKAGKPAISAVIGEKLMKAAVGEDVSLQPTGIKDPGFVESGPPPVSKEELRQLTQPKKGVGEQISETGKGLWGKTKQLAGTVGEHIPGAKYVADPKMRTLIAILGLLGAGGAGAYALSGKGGGGEAKPSA